MTMRASDDDINTGGYVRPPSPVQPPVTRQRLRASKKTHSPEKQQQDKMGRSPPRSPGRKTGRYNKMESPSVRQTHPHTWACGRLMAILLACILYGAMLVFTSMANGFPKNSVFKNLTENISRGYDVEIFPAVWTFAAWGVVFNWQLLWLGYGISTIWRRSRMGPLYQVPGHMSPWTYLLFTITCISVIAWLLLWDRKLPEYAMITSVTMPVSLYLALYSAYGALDRYEAQLEKKGKRVDIKLTRAFVLNGLACFAAWVSVAAQVNLAVVLTYTLGWPQHIACTTALCVLIGLLIIWLPIDLQSESSKYVFAPYPIFIVSTIGILAKNWDPESSNSILTAFILVISIIVTLLKIRQMCK